MMVREVIQLAAAFVLALGWDQEQEQDMINQAKHQASRQDCGVYYYYYCMIMFLPL